MPSVPSAPNAQVREAMDHPPGDLQYNRHAFLDRELTGCRRRADPSTVLTFHVRYSKPSARRMAAATARC